MAQKGVRLGRHQRRYPAVAFVIGLATVGGALCGLGILWVVVSYTASLSGVPPTAGDWAPWLIMLLLVLVGGLWVAMRVGTGSWGRHPRKTPGTPSLLRQPRGESKPHRSVSPAAWLPTHRIAAGGARAWVKPATPAGPIEWVDVEAGIEVRVEGTSGVWAVVTDHKGWTGSVDRHSLEPLPTTIPRDAVPEAEARELGTEE